MLGWLLNLLDYGKNIKTQKIIGYPCTQLILCTQGFSVVQELISASIIYAW